MSLVYLEFLRDLQLCGDYSWGSAALVFLYCILCRATRPRAREIGGVGYTSGELNKNFNLLLYFNNRT